MAAKVPPNGFVTRGGDVPYMNPDEVVIVGLDREETKDNAYAHCVRLKDISDDDADLHEYARALVEMSSNLDSIHVVRAVKDGRDAIVVDGRTTVRAARIARKIQEERGVPASQRVKVRVAWIDSEEAGYRANVDSHKHRPLTRVQYARQVVALYGRVGQDAKATAAFFKIDPKHVMNQVALMSLHESVLKAVDSGFPMAQAVALAGETKARQKEAIAELVAAGAVKGAAAANAIRKVKKGEAVEHADKTRMMSRSTITSFVEAAESAGFPEAAALIQVVLGVEGAEERIDPNLVILLRENGWKPAGEKKAKKSGPGGGEGGEKKTRSKKVAPVEVETVASPVETVEEEAEEEEEDEEAEGLVPSEAVNDNDIARPPLSASSKVPAPQHLNL